MDLFKSHDHLTEDMLFKLAKQCAKLTGVWPELSTLKTVIALINVMVFMVAGNMIQWYYIYDRLDYWRQSVDWLNIVDTIATTTIIMIFTFKIVLLAARRKSLMEIINYLRQTMLNPSIHPKAKEYNLKQWKIGYLMTFAVVGTGLSTIILYNLVPIVMNIIRIIRGLDMVRIIQFAAKYPFRTDTDPGYEFGFLCSCYMSFLLVPMLSVDVLFLTICFYLTAQFKCIQIELEHLIPDELDNAKHLSKFTMIQNEKILKRLSRIISSHNDVIAMCGETVDVFGSIILSHFLSSSLLICFVSIALIVTPIANSPKFILFLMTLLSQLYVYCYGGTCVVESSTKITNAAYSIEWYRTDPRVQRMLCLIMLRAQKGSSMNCPFFEASHPTFLNIISTAGSYITLLKTFL